MTSGGRAWAGWIAFAGTMLVLIGMVNVLQGIVALFSDDRVLVTPEHFVLVDLTSWAWTVLLSGVLMLAVSAGLFSARGWARMTAIVIVLLHAASQVLSIGAYPVWSLLMIALDTVVLFALTARWSEARDALTSYGGLTSATQMPGDPSTARVAHEMEQGYNR